MSTAARLAIGACVLAFCCRVAFMLLLAPAYFGRIDIHVDGDTLAYIAPLVNLVDHGTYSVVPENPRGLFGRMPGYPLFAGGVYLLAGRDGTVAFPLVAWIQICLDTIAVFLLFKAVEAWFPGRRVSLIVVFLYATYPFVIVWTPVVYAEALSLFVLVLALFLASREQPFLTGISVGLGALVRPQLLLLVPFVPLLPAPGDKPRLQSARWTLAYLVGAAIAFCPWPIRNALHGSLVVTQDVSAIPHYSVDVQAARSLWYSTTAGREGEFERLLRGGTMTWPDTDLAPHDKVELDQTLRLARTCGSGFATWARRPLPLSRPDCNAEVAGRFTSLAVAAQQRSPAKYYCGLPLMNLRKAIFKQSLVNADSPARRAAAKLFAYRTTLVLLGFLGGACMIWAGGTDRWVGLSILAFSAVWYALLCAGPAAMFRNVEMRYLLPADVVLLIPAAHLTSKLVDGKKGIP